MITVIIAGGSGTRLWPLSTKNNPKQLLNLTNDSSMVQNTYRRAKLMSNNVYVIPDTSHADAMRSQLPELDEDHIIVEPGRRGTANCIIAALAHISKRHDDNEPIAFIHSDHHIRDTAGFVESFKAASEASIENNAITLIGVEPTSASTGFGYIERGNKVDGNANLHEIASFKEKPDFGTAQDYIASGNYLWNCGYFVGSVNVFKNEMGAVATTLIDNYNSLQAVEDNSSDEYKDIYLGFSDEVIDVALMEKSSSLIVVPAGFDWMDIGNFNDLHAANELDEKNNYFKGENLYCRDVENTYVRNETDTPVAVIGLDNIVVVNTPDGLLVSRKDMSHLVGEIAKKAQG